MPDSGNDPGWKQNECEKSLRTGRMWSKVNFAAGTMIGLVLGSTLSAWGAIGDMYWKTSIQVAQAPRLFQMGYSAGVSDGLGAAGYLVFERNSTRSYFTKQLECLSEKSRAALPGQGLDRFTSWAISVCAGTSNPPTLPAAFTLFLEACK